MTAPTTNDIHDRPVLRPLAFEALLNAHLDGTISPTARRVLEAELASNPARRAEFERQEALAAALRAPVPVPDMSGSILSELERRGLLHNRHQRRREWLQPFAVAAGIGLAFAAGLLWGRAGARPNAAVIPEAVPGTTQIAAKASAERAVPADPDAEVRDATRTAIGLTLGSTSAYDKPLRWDTTLTQTSGADWRSLDLAAAPSRRQPGYADFWLGTWPPPRGGSLFDERPVARLLTPSIRPTIAGPETTAPLGAEAGIWSEPKKPAPGTRPDR